MKLITFVVPGDNEHRVGALKADGSVVDFGSHFGSMQSLIESGDTGLEQAHKLLQASAKVITTSNFEYRAPLPLPVQIRDFANYKKHCLQALDASMYLRSRNEENPEKALAEYKASGQYKLADIWYEQPLYFKCNRMNVIGHEQDVSWPHYSERMDYELEIACIIGKKAKNVNRENAKDYIFGYTIYNDFSARDMQSKEMAFRMGPAKGKDFDTSNVFGPCIVTKDELPDPYSLAMEVRVNGEIKAKTTSAGPQNDFERCIEHVSMDETIYPGEILALGTVGDGCGFESLTWLEENDVVELDVEGIGTLRNRLVKPK